MNDLEKKSLKKTDDIVSNRVLSVFATGAILLWALAYLYKMFDYYPTKSTAEVVCRIALLVSALGWLCGIVWCFISVKNKTLKKDKIVNPVSVSCIFAVLAICCGLLLYNYILGMKLIYVIIPAVVICYLIYNVYQRIFFVLTITHGLMSLALYFMSNCISRQSVYVYAAVCIVISLVAFIMISVTSKNNGCLKYGQKNICIFENNHIPSIKTAGLIYGISSLFVLLSLIIPIYSIIYIFYAFVAFIVCCAVYYTIRLM